MGQDLGSYSKQFITDIPFDRNDEEYLRYSQVLFQHPSEGVYIYNFERGRMVYAKGWEELIGVADDQINMLHIVNMTAPEYAPFVHEVNDKALKFLHQRNEKLKEYSFTIEIKVKHADGSLVPVTARVSVQDTYEDGRLKSILGRFQYEPGLRFGKIMRYSAYGPEKDAFENDLNESLFYPFRISDKEMEVLRLLSKGFAYKEIADMLCVSSSAIEKRIRPMFTRFEVKNNTSLVAFAYENFLLP